MQGIQAIAWEKYPPVSGVSNRLYVVVKSQKYGVGTYEIRDILKACGYNWDSYRKGWVKGFAEKDFLIKNLMAEVWTKEANVIVDLINERHIQIASFLVVNGNWKKT